MSFPGLNQDIDPLEKQRDLMAFFNEMAELDAQKERDLQERLTKEKMKVDKACMHDTELVDNCFFSSKQKVQAQAQTVAIEVVTQACDARTLHSDVSKQPLASRTASRPAASIEVNKYEYKSHKQRARALDGDDDDQQMSGRDLLASERAARVKNDLVPQRDEFGGELFSGDKGMLALVEGIDSSGYPKKLPPRLPLPADASSPRSSRSSRRSARSGRRKGRRRRKRGDSSQSEGLSATLSDRSRSQVIVREPRNVRDDDFFDEFQEKNKQQTIDNLASGGSLDRTGTISTFRRQKVGDLRLKLEHKPDLAAFRKEPERPANSRKWLLMKNKMATILVDEEMQEKMKEPHEGLQLRENYGRSEATTEKTLSQQMESVRLSEKDRINGGISEESYAEDDALFYKNNYPYDTHESISSVHTDQLEKVSRVETRKDFTAWMRESSELNQRSFNVNHVIGNFPRDRNGRIIDRREIIQRRNFRDFDGNMVNERGYLINEVSGAIRSKYTYEDVMIGEFADMGDLGELPMPYRLERYNFNPHKIMGSFQYKKQAGKADRFIFYKNKWGQFTDSLFRPVNKSGFLVNEHWDVIDDEGRVVFIRSQLEQLPTTDNLQEMYTYSGEKFRIQSIIG